MHLCSRVLNYVSATRFHGKPAILLRTWVSTLVVQLNKTPLSQLRRGLALGEGILKGPNLCLSYRNFFFFVLGFSPS